MTAVKRFGDIWRTIVDGNYLSFPDGSIHTIAQMIPPLECKAQVGFAFMRIHKVQFRSFGSNNVLDCVACILPLVYAKVQKLPCWCD